MLAARASADPERVAVLWEHGADLRRLTWAELHAVAVRGAHWLLERTRPGARVAVWAPNRPAWVILEYASALAGTVLAPLNPALVDAECEYLLESSQASLLFTVPDSAGRPLLSRADRLASRLPALIDLIWSPGQRTSPPPPRR
nr:AMP-binding protein [Frankia sp. CcI49]